jgi:hypothetical protein
MHFLAASFSRIIAVPVPSNWRAKTKHTPAERSGNQGTSRNWYMVYILNHYHLF